MDKGPTDEELRELWYGYGAYSSNKSNEEKGTNTMSGDYTNSVEEVQEFRTTKEPTDEELRELWYGYGAYSTNESNEEKGLSK